MRSKATLHSSLIFWSGLFLGIASSQLGHAAGHAGFIFRPGYLYVTGAISPDAGNPSSWSGYQVVCQSADRTTASADIDDGGLYGMMLPARPSEDVTCQLTKDNQPIAKFVFESLEINDQGERIVYPSHKPYANTTGLNLGVVALDLKSSLAWVDEYYVTETTADP